MTKSLQFHRIVKVVAGTVLVIALVISFFQRLYAPNVLVLENSPNFPNWLSWLAWFLGAIAAITYFLVDVIEWWRDRSQPLPPGENDV